MYKISALLDKEWRWSSIFRHFFLKIFLSEMTPQNFKFTPKFFDLFVFHYFWCFESKFEHMRYFPSKFQVPTTAKFWFMAHQSWIFSLKFTIFPYIFPYKIDRNVAIALHVSIHKIKTVWNWTTCEPILERGIIGLQYIKNLAKNKFWPKTPPLPLKSVKNTKETTNYA